MVIQTEVLLPTPAAQLVVNPQDPSNLPQILPLSGRIKEDTTSIPMHLMTATVPSVMPDTSQVTHGSIFGTYMEEQQSIVGGV